MSEDNELPRIDRRKFLRYCLGAAGVGAAAAGGAFVGVSTFLVEPTTVRDVDYLGPRVIGGPAPRPVGIYPLSVDDEGFFTIDASKAPEDWSPDWYRYCGHEMAPGLLKGFTPGDERLSAFIPDAKLKGEKNEKQIVPNVEWWLSLVGSNVKPEDFDLPGSPEEPGISFRWRSDGVGGLDVISGVLLRLDDDDKVAAFSDEVKDYLYQASNGSWFLAVNAYCTHFCCVPAFKETDVAKGVVIPGFGESFDSIFCTCHNSTYDQYDIVESTFELKEPEAEGGE